MREKKGWGSSVLGVFVARDKEGDELAPPPDAAEPAAPEEAPAGATPLPMGAEPVTSPPAAPGGRVDFAAVYAAAGIDTAEQARVAKAAELLGALPAGSESARQIVEASLKAFGVPVDEIIAAGENEMRALDAYVASGTAASRQALAEAQQRIAEHEQEIQRLRQAIDEHAAEQQAIERACSEGKLAVARVLEFFGHALGNPTARPSEPSKKRS
jgi:DNA-binding transcriptional MerR regulator